MDTFVSAIVSGTQPAHHTHRLRGLKMVADFSRCIEQTSKVAIETARVRIRGRPPTWYQVRSIRGTLQTKDRRDWQIEPRWRTTGTRDCDESNTKAKRSYSIKTNRAKIRPATTLTGMAKRYNWYMLNFDTEGAIVWISLIDGAFQQYIPTTRRPVILHICHYSLLAELLGERQMYDTIRQHFYWTHMANDVYITVAKRLSSARNRRMNKKQKKLPLFPPSGPFNFVTVDILRLLPKDERRNKYIVVVTDRYSKLTKAMLTAKATTRKNSNIIMKHRWPTSDYRLQYGRTMRPN